MASEIKSDKLSPSTGTALQIGDASDTITIPTGATFTITDGLGVAGGGTGLTSLTAGDVLYATGTTTLAKLAKGTAEQVLAMNSGATAPDWGSVDLTVLPTITAVKGGTGQTSFTAGDIFYANSTTTITKLGVGSGEDTLKMNSGATAPEWVTVAAGGATLTASQSATGTGSDVDFTGIPTGTKWITMQLYNVSTDGAGTYGIRIGDAGGIETTVYQGAMGGISTGGNAHITDMDTSFKLVGPSLSASNYSGIAELRLQETSSFKWVCQSVIGNAADSSAYCTFGGGNKTLSAELTQVQLLTSDTFDGGTVSIQYGS